MKTLIVIRHGQSTANAGEITKAHESVPLTPLGERQAQAISRELAWQPSQIFVSGFLRAQQTAAPFCRRHAQDAIILPVLNEFSTLDPALIQNMNGAERRPIIEAYWQRADPAQRMGEQAESFIEFDARVSSFLPLMAELPDRAVLFGHGMWLGLLIWKLLGFSGACDSLYMKAFRRFQVGLPMPNTAVYTLHDAAQDAWQVKADAHLLRLSAAVR